MSRNRARNSTLVMSFPRVSGDEPEVLRHEHERMTFSPRERG